MSNKIKDSGLLLSELYEIMVGVIRDKESDLNSRIRDIKAKKSASVESGETEGKSSEVAQADILDLQSRVSSWSTIIGIATGILRAVADAMRATTQNIR
jgi:hypothetical protein